MAPQAVYKSFRLSGDKVEEDFYELAYYVVNSRDFPQQVPAFGEEMRKEFLLDFERDVFVNQGSYGVSPTRVVKYK